MYLPGSRPIQRAQEVQRRISGYSPADEVAKLTKLRDEGSITDQEYTDLKRRALMPT